MDEKTKELTHHTVMVTYAYFTQLLPAVEEQVLAHKQTSSEESGPVIMAASLGAIRRIVDLFLAKFPKDLEEVMAETERMCDDIFAKAAPETTKILLGVDANAN